MPSPLSKAGYVIRQWTTEGIAVLDHARYGRQVWTRGKARKDCRCAVTGRLIRKGRLAYRPLTNQHNRRERIAPAEIERGFLCR